MLDLFTEKLKKLKPVANMLLDGLSLVVKYSKTNPDLLLTADD
jgi:hypothetical protein